MSVSLVMTHTYYLPSDVTEKVGVAHVIGTKRETFSVTSTLGR
jgi:hypothetical protein